MHILSQNLFKFSCDQGGIVMVTLQAPYKKELEAKYLRQYPDCSIYYEKVIRHTKVWRCLTLKLMIENIIIVDHKTQKRYKSVILPDFIPPYTRYLFPFFEITLANILDKEKVDLQINDQNLAMCLIEFLEQFKIHPEDVNIMDLDDTQQSNLYKKMRSYLVNRIKQIQRRVNDAKKNFVAINNTTLAHSPVPSVIMSVTYRFIKSTVLCKLYSPLSSMFITSCFQVLFLSFVKHFDYVCKIQSLHEVMQIM